MVLVLDANGTVAVSLNVNEWSATVAVFVPATVSTTRGLKSTHLLKSRVSPKSTAGIKLLYNVE